VPPSVDVTWSLLRQGRFRFEPDVTDGAEEAGVLTWESRSSSSCILSLIDSMSMEVWLDGTEETVDSGDLDGVTMAVLPPDAGAEAGLGAIVI
jgi:hypothetical protein